VTLWPSKRVHTSLSESSEPGHAPETPLRRSRNLLRFVFREERFFLILSVFIGIFAGLAVVCFRYAIELSHIYLLRAEIAASPWRLILTPTLAGLVIGVLVLHVFPLARGSGVNQTKAALYIFNGYIPFRTAIGKFITSSLAIGSGHSLGPEDPSLQIGAGLASALGRRLHLSRERMRLIAPVGAAAGLGAAFNAPISAVLFVIEEVIGRWSAGILGSVVLSAVSSVVVMRWFLGSQPLFRVPPVELIRPAELITYAALGVAGGLASVIFSGGIGLLRPRLKKMPRWTQYFQPAVAGLAIGCIAVLGAPQVMGAGYEFIDQAIHNQFTWEFLGILVILKIVATICSFVTGTPGGMFAPTLFIGAMLGAFAAGLEHNLFPHLAISTGTYAMVGMGVLFAGFLRAPMTSVFMVLEVSGNYTIILPVIVANTFAYVISRALQPVPIFDMLTRQDGLDLPSMEEQREEDVLRVEDAMREPPNLVLDAEQTITQAIRQLDGIEEENILVRRHRTGWNTVSSRELGTRLREGNGELSILSALPVREIPYLHPDHSLDVAMRYVYRWPVVPVVSRADLGKLEGIVSKEDVLKQYQAVEEDLQA